jgi:uncharacterized membrane protein
MLVSDIRNRGSILHIHPPSSTPVQNTLVVCNHADETAYVAISFEGSDTGTYETEGWWQVAPWPVLADVRAALRITVLCQHAERKAMGRFTSPLRATDKVLMPSETPQIARVTQMLI